MATTVDSMVTVVYNVVTVVCSMVTAVDTSMSRRGAMASVVYSIYILRIRSLLRIL